MIPNYDIHERLAQEHRQDLLREAERERLLAQLPHSKRHVLLLSPLLLSWHALRMRVQKRLQRRID